VTIESFTSLLDGTKQTSRGWAFQCPAHADRHPSGAATEGEDGRILVKCWAGCTAAEIVAAMGLTLADLFPDTRKSPAEIQRQKEARERKRAADEAERKREGLQVDARREADYFIRSRKDLEIGGWSDEELDDEMESLAVAYGILEEEVTHDVCRS
jgi:hypothetical protein